jgi:hypothetical protein
MLGMPLSFAFAVRRLQREGFNVTDIARELRAPLNDVLEAHRLLDLPINADADQPAPAPAAGDRQAQLEQLPKRIAERIRRAREDAT